MKRMLNILGAIALCAAFLGQAHAQVTAAGSPFANQAAATATALAANPADCAANQFANAIAANGDLTCAQPSTFGDITATTLLATGRIDPDGGVLVPNNVSYQARLFNGTGFNVASVTAGNVFTLGAVGTPTRLASLATAGIVTSDGSGNITSETATGTDAPVRATSPTLVTPTLGVASATSINFGGTALANYVEGTCTPTIAGSTGAGVGTYDAQTCNYTRIGNRVTLNIRVGYSATTGTGNAIIGGLPIASNGSMAHTPCSVQYDGAVANKTAYSGYILGGESQMRVMAYESGAAAAPLPIQAAATIFVSCTYPI